MFLCLVWGVRFPAEPAAVVSVPRTARESQAVKSVSLLGRRPPPAALSEVGDSLVCACVTRRRRAATTNCPAGHGWRGGGGGTGVYGYGALFLCCGCEAGSYEITSRGE